MRPITLEMAAFGPTPLTLMSMRKLRSSLWLAKP